MMKVYKYKLQVCDGAIAMIHGMYEAIEEYYFPDPVNLCFNYKYVFSADEKEAKERRAIATDIEEVEIGDGAMGGRLIMLSANITAMKAAEREVREILKLDDPATTKLESE